MLDITRFLYDLITGGSHYSEGWIKENSVKYFGFPQTSKNIKGFIRKWSFDHDFKIITDKKVNGNKSTATIKSGLSHLIKHNVIFTLSGKYYGLTYYEKLGPHLDDDELFLYLVPCQAFPLKHKQEKVTANIYYDDNGIVAVTDIDNLLISDISC